MRARRSEPWRLAHIVLLVAALTTWGARTPQTQSAAIQFVFTSDPHYGITRDWFRQRTHVDAHVVNAAMVATINGLPTATFPRDDGLRAGEQVGALEFVAEGGDIAHRQEVTKRGAIQAAAKSWAQFKTDYLDGLHVVDRAGARAPVYVVPGNHDVSNAIGYFLPMAPPTDSTSMVAIYNHMMAPGVLKNASTYHYPADKVLVSHDIGGVHFVFITMWPDSGTRAWMERDLASVDRSTPVIMFAHDPPHSETRHFTNPNGTHNINAVDQFENLIADTLADGSSVARSTRIEQRALENFLLQHPNITAYFHGHSNWNQFYDWTGPRHRVVLHTFRVDSPMKGAVSAGDETKLSFQVVTIDSRSRRMTVRECLWNVDPRRPSAPVAWGASTTVELPSRPGAAKP